MGKKVAAMRWAITAKPRREPDPLMTIVNKLVGNSHKDGAKLVLIPGALAIIFLILGRLNPIASIFTLVFIGVFAIGVRAASKIENDAVRENAKRLGIENLLGEKKIEP